MPKTTISANTNEKQALLIVKDLLLRAGLVVTLSNRQTRRHALYDAIFNVRRKGLSGQLRLGVEVKSSGVPRFLFEFAGKVAMKREKGLYPVYVAPYISERGAEILRFHKVGFCDFAGNAHLETNLFLISKKGGSNPVAKRKEIRSLFSPKATRITRALLLDPIKGPTQSALAAELNLSIGYVNTVLKKLQDQQYVFREREKWYVADREGLLTAWTKAYSFSINPIVGALYTSDPLEEFAGRLDNYCAEKNVSYALTLFAAARYRAAFVSYPRLHAYFSGTTEDLIESLGLKIVSTGGNIVLVRPYDEGVYHGSQQLDDCRMVSDVQLYVDLATFGGRGEEQAVHLASERMKHLLLQRSVDEQVLLREFLRLRDSGFAAFSAKDYETAALYYGRAMEQVPGKWDDNTEMHKTTTGILYWQSLIAAAFYEIKRKRAFSKGYTDKAESLYKSYQDVWPVVERTQFPQGPIFLTLLRLSVLKWFTENNKAERRILAQQIMKYSELASSPYTTQTEESSAKEAIDLFNTIQNEELTS